MKIHFIAIGGSAMHNLAIALHKKGYDISGSDDEIFEPSKSRLKKYGLLPSKTGWDTQNIHHRLDAVILGMHAKADNPEMLKAKELGIKTFSYPEFLYEQSKDKTRVVIGGSHGKTTITSMILHVLQYHNIEVDYMVGAQLEGFEVMVKLTDDASIIILEGDEYLSSALDKRPKFHLYKPHVALISGIAWDHINVFPTFDNYLDQFRKFIQIIEPGGKLIYFSQDKHIRKIVSEVSANKISIVPYDLPVYQINKGVTTLTYKEKKYNLQVFGKHNLQNIEGAMKVCKELDIREEMFLEAITGFLGASNRLQLLARSHHSIAFKDFAHAPSKLMATTQAVKEQFPDKNLIACMELHTYSSLSKTFLDEYHGAMLDADRALVYYNTHALELKRLPELSKADIRAAFGGENVEVFNDSTQLKKTIFNLKNSNSAYLFMSSGNFGGLNIEEMARNLVE